MKPAVTSATLALIAETELVNAQELPSLHTALTVARAVDSAGSIIPRRFTCSADVLGQPVTHTAGTKFAAHSGLQRQVRLLGFEPMWNAVRDFTEAADEPAPVIEPVFVAPREIPNMPEGQNLHTPATETDELGEHEAPKHGLVHKLPKLDNGRVTPVSDPDAYKAIYFAAFTLASNGFVSPFTQDKALFDLGEKSGVEGRGRTLRRHVAQVMASGEAGTSVGIPAVAVDPWALVNGQADARWIRVLHLPDPTTKGARKGDGERREAFSTNLSGLPDTERARMWLERREANRYVGTKGRNSVGSKAERTTIRLQCHLAAKAAKEIAVNGGEDELTADLQYRWVYAATMRNLGEIHSVFETQLAEQGVTEQMILDYAAAQKVA
jgi:hypothetical protein